MNDRRQKRLELLKRLREMNMEQARSEHVAANAELEQRREKADQTEQRIESLDAWTVERLSQGSTLSPELLQQTRLFRGVEKHSLDQQRGDETQQREVTETARRALTVRFEELSVVERLALRHAEQMNHEQLRRGFVELDEAGIRKSLEPKE
jgi:flagellar biosynthesis chaperone FliJ